jgi:hypothetical protein
MRRVPRPTLIALVATAGAAGGVLGRFRFETGETEVVGRRIELKPDNTFHFTDDGSDTVQFSLLGQAGSPPTNGTAVLKAGSDGSFVLTGQTANFNITALSGTLVLTLQNGQVVNIPLPPDGAGVKETVGLNGDATYTCQGKTVTFRFPALAISLERA